MPRTPGADTEWNTRGASAPSAPSGGGSAPSGGSGGGRSSSGGGGSGFANPFKQSGGFNAALLSAPSESTFAADLLTAGGTPQKNVAGEVPAQLKAIGKSKKLTKEWKDFQNAGIDTNHPDVQALAETFSPQEIMDIVQSGGITHEAFQFPSGPSGAQQLAADQLQGLAALQSGNPALANPASTSYIADPSNPQQFAADILQKAGLPDTPSNEKLLQGQMTVEGMPGSENNPLATTVQGPGSYGVNSVGVQAFPTAQGGVAADAQTLQQGNMSTIYNALKSGNATPQDYAAALAGSAYEGNDPTANAAYANSFLSDVGAPAQSFPGGGSSAYTGGSAGGGASPGGSSIGSLLQSIYSPMNTTIQDSFSQMGANSNALTEQSNTTNAPGSPDQAQSIQQKVNPQQAAAYQQMLQQLLPNIIAGGGQ